MDQKQWWHELLSELWMLQTHVLDRYYDLDWILDTDPIDALNGSNWFLIYTWIYNFTILILQQIQMVLVNQSIQGTIFDPATDSNGSS